MLIFLVMMAQKPKRNITFPTKEFLYKNQYYMTKKKAKCNLARNLYLLKSLVQQIHSTDFSQKSDLT